MTEQFLLIVWLITWMLAVLVIIFWQWKQNAIGAGLSFAYLFQLSLIHWLGASIYVVPGYQNDKLPTVLAGFEQATFGIIAFAIGILILGPLLLKVLQLSNLRPPTHIVDSRLPRVYLALGSLSYFVLSSLLGGIPTLSALVSVGSQLILVGICLECWRAWQARQRAKFIGCVALATLLPFITIVTQGFLGYGLAAFATVLSFLAAFVRPRRGLVIAGSLLIYLGLSFYVSYMRDRTDIRDTVWGGLALGSRVQSVLNTVQTTEWFDPSDVDHLDRIDARLNQNYLVGVSVESLRSGWVGYAGGETIWQAALALVPRALWPDKPVFAGSPGIVSRFTGIQFAPGTSVGIGQVMEFYINFGESGIVIGFLIIGSLIAVADFVAGQRLRQGDWESMVLWYLPGLALLQTGGSLVEVVGTMGASILMVVLVNRLLLPFLTTRRPLPITASAIRASRPQNIPQPLPQFTESQSAQPVDKSS